jgi:hypothetical protein
MTIPIIIALLIMAAAGILFGLSLAKAAARGDRLMRRERQLYLLRYRGGDEPCRICRRPTAYGDQHGPIHVGCRREET